jgi:hypothetical protein
MAPKVVSEPNPVTGTYNSFPAYSFTGPTRPVYPLSPIRTLPKSIRRPDWADDGIPKAERRLNRSKIDLLDARGQEAMRKVCKLAREVLDIGWWLTLSVYSSFLFGYLKIYIWSINYMCAQSSLLVDRFVLQHIMEYGELINQT